MSVGVDGSGMAAFLSVSNVVMKTVSFRRAYRSTHTSDIYWGPKVGFYWLVDSCVVHRGSPSYVYGVKMRDVQVLNDRWIAITLRTHVPFHIIYHISYHTPVRQPTAVVATRGSDRPLHIIILTQLSNGL